MDQAQYRNLLEGVQAVPAPRPARGKPLAWPLRWGVIASALRRNQRPPAAIAQWAKQPAALLLAALRPARGRIPRAATIRRTLRQVDSQAFAAQRAGRPTTRRGPPARRIRVTLAWPSRCWQIAPRGGAHGQPLELGSLVEHGRGRGLAQTAVAPHQHARRAVPELLAGRDVRGGVGTRDAG